MRSFFFKKGIVFLLSLWCAATLAFLLVHAIPGDPFIGDREIPEEVLRSLFQRYGLDKPLAAQYFTYLKNILSGNFGPSIVYPEKNVSSLIWEGFCVSAPLGLKALLLAIGAGLSLGILAAKKQKSWKQETADLLSCLGFSLPIFALASLLQWFFCIYFPLLPPARLGTFSHTILPVVSLAALPTASIARLTKARLIEIFEQDYIQAAKAKGLSGKQILFRHAIKNALFPVIAYLGPASVHLLTGSFIVEKIFSIPGLGKEMIASIAARDYPMILGLTIFLSAFLMLSTFLVDAVLHYLDPRESPWH